MDNKCTCWLQNGLNDCQDSRIQFPCQWVSSWANYTKNKNFSSVQKSANRRTHEVSWHTRPNMSAFAFSSWNTWVSSSAVVMESRTIKSLDLSYSILLPTTQRLVCYRLVQLSAHLLSHLVAIGWDWGIQTVTLKLVPQWTDQHYHFLEFLKSFDTSANVPSSFWLEEYVWSIVTRIWSKKGN